VNPALLLLPFGLPMLLVVLVVLVAFLALGGGLWLTFAFLKLVTLDAIFFSVGFRQRSRRYQPANATPLKHTILRAICESRGPSSLFGISPR
jgi:hypothetical protein